MAWDVVMIFFAICLGFWSVTNTLRMMEHQAKRSADSLVNIEVTLEQISSYLGMIEGEVSSVRRKVAPTPLPWESDDELPTSGT